MGTFWIIFAAVGLWVVGNVVWGIVRFGSLRGWAFGARVGDSFGEVTHKGRVSGSSRIKICRLHPLTPDGPTVGIEFVKKRPGSYQMDGFPLTREDALRLADMLRAAGQID